MGNPSPVVHECTDQSIKAAMGISMILLFLTSSIFSRHRLMFCLLQDQCKSGTPLVEFAGEDEAAST